MLWQNYQNNKTHEGVIPGANNIPTGQTPEGFGPGADPQTRASQIRRRIGDLSRPPSTPQGSAQYEEDKVVQQLVNIAKDME